MIEIKEKVGTRITAIVEMMPSVANMADIGCDHGYTGLLAMANKKAIEVVASDISEPSLQKAYELADSYGMSIFYKCRLGDGLSVIEKDEVDAIIISGIGGELMRDILEKGKHKISDLTTLVLAPNNREDMVRNWLYFDGFEVIKEKIVEENEKFYQIIVAKRSKSSIRDLSDTTLGHHLFQTDDATLKKYYDYKIAQLNIVLNNLEKAENEAEKIAEIRLRIAMYEEKRNDI